VQKNPEILGGLKNITSKGDGEGTKENPFPLQFSNIQLMTPGGLTTDGDMPEKQMKAFEELAKNPPIELKIPAPDGESVWIKLEEPLLFNFGVNLQQFNKLARKVLVNHSDITRELRGWNAKSLGLLMGDTSKIASGEINAASINLEEETKLFSEQSKIGKFLERPDISDGDKKVVVQLAHQIAKLWESGEYETNGSEPDAIAVRLTLLSHRLGLATSFNCKSGKDRTGEVNVSIEYLATEIEMNGGIVPEPYHDFDNREMFNLNRILAAGGADHVTRACTGVGGLKLISSFGPAKFSGVEDRFGEVRGASNLGDEKPGSLKTLKRKALWRTTPLETLRRKIRSRGGNRELPMAISPRKRRVRWKLRRNDWKLREKME
jgi:hypothetical protein